MQWFFLLVVLLVLAGFLIGPGEVGQPAGVLAPSEPWQRPAMVRPWEVNGAQVQPLAEYSLRARVLATRRYWFDAGSRYSPIDVAVGWGPMSDTAVLQWLSLSQGFRGLSYRARRCRWPIPPEQVNSRSANMHLIPAGGDVKKVLFALRRGDVVELSGFLVRVQGPGGFHWVSSLSREDKGQGACELMWVNRAAVCD